MRAILFSGLIILLAGCTTTTFNSSIQDWRGADVKELVERWGKPDIQLPEQNGNQVYVYKIRTYRNHTAAFAPQVGVNVAGGRPIITTVPSTNFAISRSTNAMLTCITTFTVNAQDKITTIKTQGQACNGGSTLAKRFNEPAN